MTAAVARHHVQPAPRTAPRPGERSGRPNLRVLDQAAARRRARRRTVMALASVLVVVGLFGVALAHAELVEGQQDLDDLRARIAELENERAQIERAVDEASSPAVVVQRAEELGMVRAEQPVYLAAVRGAAAG